MFINCHLGVTADRNLKLENTESEKERKSERDISLYVLRLFFAIGTIAAWLYPDSHLS